MTRNPGGVRRASSIAPRLRLAAGLAVTAAALWVTGCARTTEVRQPNIVFFLADDLGISDLGCYGSTFHETPHIDRLATGGMMFSQAYAACPVCSPTRISIMTGKYPARTGVTSYIPGNQNFPKARMKAVENKLFMEPDEVTIAETLKAGGYATACVGKWHLGGDDSDADQQGFDLYATRGTRGEGGVYTGSPPLEGEAGEYMTDRFAKTAVKFIRDHKDGPFFLYFAFHNPHIPLVAKPEVAAKYEQKLASMDVQPGDALNCWPGAAQNNPLYAAMIESVDDAVGLVLAEIEAQGLTEDTIAIFFSDNGGLAVPEWQCQIPTTNAPYRAGKGHLYEGGVREPLIVKWPGITKPGSTCDTPVTSTDFYPTLVQAANILDYRGNPLDGVSLIPLLQQRGGLSRDAIFWHYPHYSNQLGRPGGAIREGDWKLIEFFGDGRLELYNLAEDPGERNNLASEMAEKTAALHAKLKAWQAEVGAKMPTPNPAYDPANEWEGLRWYVPCGAKEIKPR